MRKSCAVVNGRANLTLISRNSLKKISRTALERDVRLPISSTSPDHSSTTHEQGQKQSWRQEGTCRCSRKKKPNISQYLERRVISRLQFPREFLLTCSISSGESHEFLTILCFFRHVIYKLLGFTLAMVVGPIGSYFLTLNLLFKGML